jgi:hypothetical protein
MKWHVDYEDIFGGEGIDEFGFGHMVEITTRIRRKSLTRKLHISLPQPIETNKQSDKVMHA